MEIIKKKIKAFCQTESGATTVEYAILLALIAAAMVVSVRGTGTGAANTLDIIATAITDVVN